MKRQIGRSVMDFVQMEIEHFEDCYVYALNRSGIELAVLRRVVGAIEDVDLCGCIERSQRRAKVKRCQYGCCVTEASLVPTTTGLGGDVMLASEAASLMQGKCRKGAVP